MKTFKYKIVAITVITLLASCNRNEEDPINTINNNGIKVVNLSRTSNVQVNELGVYGMEFSALNDFTLRNKITRYRSSEGIKDHLSSYVLAKETSDLNSFNEVVFSGLNFEKTTNIMEPMFLKAYRAKNGTGIKDKVKEIANTMFGQEQMFSLKTNKYTIEESLYIPKLLVINTLGDFDESLNKYIVNRNSLSIKYNIDTNNKNGVAALILWDGTTQDMSLQELGNMNMEYRNKIVVFDPIDSGVLNVPQSALSKFPSNANITIVLMRGNAKIINRSNKNHYLVTSSEIYEHIILKD